MFDELVKDTYNSEIGYLGKSRGNQTEEQRHRTFTKHVLKGKLRKAVQFFYDRERRVALQPEKLDEDHTGMVNKTAISDLEGKTSDQNTSLMC